MCSSSGCPQNDRMQMAGSDAGWLGQRVLRSAGPQGDMVRQLAGQSPA